MFNLKDMIEKDENLLFEKKNRLFWFLDGWLCDSSCDRRKRLKGFLHLHSAVILTVILLGDQFGLFSSMHFIFLRNGMENASVAFFVFKIKFVCIS